MSLFHSLADHLIRKRSVFTGVIYFQKVSDNRFSASMRKHLLQVSAIYSPTHPRFVVVTTFWAKEEASDYDTHERNHKDIRFKHIETLGRLNAGFLRIKDKVDCGQSGRVLNFLFDKAIDWEPLDYEDERRRKSTCLCTPCVTMCL
jgi:hypothetical protein